MTAVSLVKICHGGQASTFSSSRSSPESLDGSHFFAEGPSGNRPQLVFSAVFGSFASFLNC